MNNRKYLILTAVFITMALVTMASKAECVICLQSTCSTSDQCGYGCMCITDPYELRGECYRVP